MACTEVRSVVQDLALAVRLVVMRAALLVPRAGAPSRLAQSALKTTSASYPLMCAVCICVAESFLACVHDCDLQVETSNIPMMQMQHKASL